MKQKFRQEEAKSSCACGVTDPFQIPDTNKLIHSDRCCIVSLQEHVDISSKTNHSISYALERNIGSSNDKKYCADYYCEGTSTHIDVESVVASKIILPNWTKYFQSNNSSKNIFGQCTANLFSKMLQVRNGFQNYVFYDPSNKCVDRSIYQIDESKRDNEANDDKRHQIKKTASSYERYRRNIVRKKLAGAKNLHIWYDKLSCGCTISRKEIILYAIAFGTVLNVAVLQIYFTLHHISTLDNTKRTKFRLIYQQRRMDRVHKKEYRRQNFVRIVWPAQRATDIHQRTDNFYLADIESNIRIQQIHDKCNTDMDTAQKIIGNRKKERRRRTNKLSIQEHPSAIDFMIEKFEMTSSDWMKKTILTEDRDRRLVIEASTVESLSDHLENACSDAGLTASSRVILTDILTIPAASAFALLIAKHCKVKFIHGVDSMMPNTQNHRVGAMNVYQSLLHRIPNIKLVVPNDSAGFDIWSNMKELTANNSPFFRESLHWIREFNPTHIIHFESILTPTFERSRSTNSVEDDDQLSSSFNRLFLMKKSFLSTEQLLRYALHIGESRQNKMQLPQSTRFLYVSSKQQLPSNYNEQLLWNGLFTGNQILFQSYLAMSKAASPHECDNLSIHQLHFPDQNEKMDTFHQDSRSVSVNEAVMAILRSLKEENCEPVEFSLPITSNHNSSVDHSVNDALLNDFHYHLTGPFEPAQETIRNYDKNGLQYLLGLDSDVFPCASSCARGVEQRASNSQQCTASPFDDIIPISIEATRGCGYVVFVVEVSHSLNGLVKPLQTTISQAEALPLCRIAFVSEHSALVKDLVKTNHTLKHEDEREWFRTMNGKMKHESWTVIWLPYQDESMMSDADFSLLIIDPSKFFAPTVAKSMYTSVLEFAEPSDESLLRIMGGINRPAIPRHMEKEYRSGHKIFRFVVKEAESARSVALFGMEPSVNLQTLSDYEMLLNTNDSSVAVSDKQLKFYKEASYLIESQQFRLETEIQRENYFDRFPFQWISMATIIHDLKLDVALSLRCNWYKEHLFWGTHDEISRRKGTEPLSLAYLLGKIKLDGTIGQPIDNQKNWYPLLDTNTNNVLRNERGAGVFLRIMKRAAD
jgi:hypothetical protein